MKWFKFLFKGNERLEELEKKLEELSVDLQRHIANYRDYREANTENYTKIKTQLYRHIHSDLHRSRALDHRFFDIEKIVLEADKNNIFRDGIDLDKVKFDVQKSFLSCDILHARIKVLEKAIIQNNNKGNKK